MSQPPVVSFPNNPGWSRWIERLRAATAGRFTIIRELGRGGFAAVFLAQQSQPNRRVAIKLLLPTHLESQWALDHFRGESQKISEWRHQSVVTIYEVAEVDDLIYFVMSYVEGGSLADLIQALGPLSIPATRSILAQMGSAIQYAHRNGVTHRDIKPQNVLIDTDGGAVVTDFGISKQAGGTSHTVTGMIFGTPQYMAPEQAEHGTTSIASDQYALGIVAYEMLTGSPPFNGAAMSVLISHMEKPVPMLRTVRPDCPPELEAAVARMVSKNPADRFASITDAMHAAGAAELRDSDPERQRLATAARQVAARAQAQTIDIVSIPPQIEVGDKIPIEASARTIAGDPITAGTVKWSLDNDRIAALDAETGVLTALVPGTALLVAKSGGMEQQIRVDVVPAKVATIQVSAPTGPMRVGERAQLRAAARSKTGMPVNALTVWTSDDPKLATISSEGVLQAHGAGRTRVRAQVEEIVSEFWVEVTAPTVTEVRIAGAPEKLTLGDTRQLRAVVLDSSDNTLADRVVQWTSNDRRVATVSSAGLVTATASGAVTITATVEGSQASFTLAVEEPLAARIELQKAPGTVRVGDRVRLRAVAHDAHGHAIARAVTWSTDNESVASVGADGTVTGIAQGRVHVTAALDGVTAMASLEVGRSSAATPVPVRASAAPVPSPATPRATRAFPPWLKVGGGGVLVAGIATIVVLNSGGPSSPASATPTDAKAPVSGGSQSAAAPSTPAVQTPTPTTKIPSASTPAPATPRGNPPANVPVNSPVPPARRIELTATSAALIVGDSIAVQAGTSDRSPLTGVQWSTSDASKATVSAAGMVRALADGAVAIIARVGSMADTLQLEVQPRPARPTSGSGQAPLIALPPPVTTPPRDSVAPPVTRAPPPVNPGPSAAALAEQSVRQLVSDYAAALGSENLAAATRLYPGMPRGERSGWQALFDASDSLKVNFRVETVDVSKSPAVLRVGGENSYYNKSMKKSCRRR